VWRATVVVKASFDMVDDRPMRVGRLPKIVEERDLAPLRPAVEIGLARGATWELLVYRDAQPVAGDALGFLRGNEWIELIETPPAHGRGHRVRSQLPRARGLAMVVPKTDAAARAVGAPGKGSMQPLALVADHVFARPSSATLTLSWRGRLEVDDEALLDELLIVGGLSLADGDVAWPTIDELMGGEDVPSRRSSMPTPQGHGTNRVTLTDASGLTVTLDPRAIAAATGRGVAREPQVAPFELAGPGESKPRAPAGAPFSGEVAPEVAPPEAGAQQTVGLSGAEARRPELGEAERFFRERTEELQARSAVPRRTTEAIPIANDTELELTYLPWQHQPPEDSLTIVVKGTFDLVPGGAARLADETELNGDALEETGTSLRYASDFALYKPAADVTLVGCAHVPGGRREEAMRVRFRFGQGNNAFDRSIAVFGPRKWERAALGLRPSKPRAFTQMPLSYEHAFGGPGHADNPAGTGAYAQRGAVLPNLEDPEDLVTGAKSAPRPACFAPIQADWQARAGRVGTYDDGWLKTRWPYFPADFDWRFFQSAPEAQQLEHLEGDEPFTIVGAHPEHGVLEGTLPGLKPRCFMLTSGSTSGAPGADHAFERVALSLDTVAFDTDAMKVHLVWRGVVEVTDEHAPEIEWLYLAADEGGEDTDDTELHARFRAYVLPLVPVAEPEPPANDVAPSEREREMSGVEREIAERVSPLPAASSSDGLRAPPEVAPPRQLPEVLEGADLAGADLRGHVLSGQSLRGANLTGAILRGCMLSAVDLSDALLAGADLRDAVLDAADLSRADLTGANLEGASLVGARVEDADATKAMGDRANLQLTRGARFRLSGGSWRSARFEGAHLERLDLSGATYHSARFDGATLVMCRLFDGHGDDASFAGADITDALGDGVRLARANLGKVSASGSCWENADFEGASFLEAMLDEVSFVRANLERADLSACSLRRARMKRAVAERAKLVSSNLEEAQLERSNFAAADFTGANLFGAELWHTVLDRAVLTGANLARTKKEA
jgi:uncharacterized protein YjbI with pentapeptide repeats